MDHEVQHRHELVDLVLHRHASEHRLETRVDLEEPTIENRTDGGAIRSQRLPALGHELPSLRNHGILLRVWVQATASSALRVGFSTTGRALRTLLIGDAGRAVMQRRRVSASIAATVTSKSPR